jgi:hypothetical protein
MAACRFEELIKLLLHERKLDNYIYSFFFFSILLYQQASADGNVTLSTLMFTPKREDNEKTIECRALNVLVKRGLKEASYKLNVFCEYSNFCLPYCPVPG